MLMMHFHIFEKRLQGFFFYISVVNFEKKYITFSDGCLGSRNDEERSEMRYVMRIAESVNHQTFERTLHFSVSGKYFCLSVCSPYSLNFSGLWVLCVAFAAC